MKKQIPPKLTLLLGLTLFVSLAIIYLLLQFSLNITDRQKLLTTYIPYQETKDPLITKVQTETLTAPTEKPYDFVYGNPTAPITIFEFSDFACPYCSIMSSLLIDAVDNNPETVKLVWKDFPVTSLYRNSPSAHVAARCAGEQNKFWEYSNELFSAQQNFDRENLLAIAQKLSLKPDAFVSCIDGNIAPSEILQNMQEGNALGVDGTPYLFINDQRISGLVTKEELEQIIRIHKLINN